MLPVVGLRSKVETEIQHLIIEPAEGPKPWISPVVVVAKPNGEVLFCVDMRWANEAIIRERHPIPTVDEVLQELSRSRYFTKFGLAKKVSSDSIRSRVSNHNVRHSQGLFRY